jgi:hypothetical protein
VAFIDNAKNICERRMETIITVASKNFLRQRGKYLVLGAAVASFFLACTAENTEEPRKASPVVVFKSRPQSLSQEQRNELNFPPELISQVETAAGAAAEPFFETVWTPSKNLKGDIMLGRERLAGFSVHTTKAEKVITALSDALRKQGYLIFKSEHNYGSVPNAVTVIKGTSQYDVLAMQKTEGTNYKLSTAAIVKWLKARQKICRFVITGAGPDWVQARFIRPPKDMNAFAREVSAFAPDVVSQGAKSVAKLAQQMKQANSFYLWWE